MNMRIVRLVETAWSACQRILPASTIRRKAGDHRSPEIVPEPEASKADKVSEFYVAKARVDREDHSERESDVRVIISALEKLATTFVRSIDVRGMPEVIFELDSHPSPHVRRLATAAPIPGTTGYRVRLTIALVDLLMMQVDGALKDWNGSYRLQSAVLLAAFAVVAHEFAHVAHGHLATPNSAGKAKSDISRAIESDADYRAGQALPALYLLPETKAIAEEFGGIKNREEYAIASFLGILLLCTFLQSADDRSDKYHRPSTRRRVLDMGLTMSLMAQDPQMELIALLAVANAAKTFDQLKVAFPDPKHDLLRGDEDDWKAFNEKTVPIMSKYIVDALLRSPFL